MKQTPKASSAFKADFGGSFCEGGTSALATVLEHNWKFKIHLLPRLEQEFPWVLTRSMTDADFHRFCERHGITVVLAAYIPYGVYVRYAGEHFIFLNPRLEGPALVYVMAHELAHYLFHSPERSRSRQCHSNHHVIAMKEFEAETVATLLCRSENQTY